MVSRITAPALAGMLAARAPTPGEVMIAYISGLKFKVLNMIAATFERVVTRTITASPIWLLAGRPGKGLSWSHATGDSG